MEEETRFWMVFVDGAGGPARKHPSLEAAMVEAERLTRKTHKSVYLLRPIMVVDEADHPVVYRLIPSITPVDRVARGAYEIPPEVPPDVDPRQFDLRPGHGAFG